MITDFVQIQNDLAHALLCAPALANVNVLQYRKLRLDSMVSMDTLWLAGRNGRSGAGVLVEMPVFNVPKPNLAGPQTELVFPFAVVEEPNINYAPQTGTLLSAEEISQLVLDTLHGLRLNTMGFSLYAAPQAVQSIEDFANLVGYRVRLMATVSRAQTDRVAMPAAAVVGSTVTLSGIAIGAEVRYTTDGTFPGPSNPAASIYDAPFDVDSGTLIRWAAYLAGYNGSHVGSQITT